MISINFNDSQYFWWKVLTRKKKKVTKKGLRKNIVAKFIEYSNFFVETLQTVLDITDH